MSIAPLAGVQVRANASHSARIGPRFAAMKSARRTAPAAGSASSPARCRACVCPRPLAGASAGGAAGPKLLSISSRMRYPAAPILCRSATLPSSPACRACSTSISE